MSVGEQEFSRRGSQVGLAVLLALAAIAALWFVASRLVAYGTVDPGAYGDLWPRRIGFLPHMAGGIVAILTGIAQLWLGLTGRTAGWHRILGRIYVGGVAVGAAGGFYLALTITGGFAYAAGLFTLAVAWIVTTTMAVIAIHNRSIEQHREWMIRSYVVTFAFVTFRFFDHWLGVWKVAPNAEIDSFMAFACWSIPLLIAEPLIQFSKVARVG